MHVYCCLASSPKDAEVTTQIHHLTPIVVPEASGMKRELPPRSVDPQNPGWNAYDYRTLMYGAIQLEDKATVRLYMPRVFNFKDLLQSSRFHIDGKPSRILKWRQYRRYEVIDLEGTSRSAHELVVTYSESQKASAVVYSDSASFAGCRVLYTMLRNEKLEWIQDWIRFHAEEHGANAVLLVDNGSSDYSLSDLLTAANTVPGIEVAEVLSAPLPWGHTHRAPRVDDAEFLQTAMLNFSRDRFFSQARAVLYTDIDELVLRRGDVSVFDAVKPWGYATFPGHWYYCENSSEPVRHKDHVFHDPTEKECPT